MNHSSQFTRKFISICLALLIFSVSVFIIHGGYSLIQSFSFAEDSEKEQTASLPAPSEQNSTPTANPPASPPASDVQSTTSHPQSDDKMDHIDLKQPKGTGSEEKKNDSRKSDNHSDSSVSSAPTKPWMETVKIQNDEIRKEGISYYLKKGQKVIMKIYSAPVSQAKHRINATLLGPGSLPHHLSDYGTTKEFVNEIPADGMYTLVLECNYQKNADCSGKATFWVAN